MKGFGIWIQNDLLEPKHVEAMGQAVWLYMWLIDHMTSISEEGVGRVLGGRPVKFTEVGDELGISEDTYGRWIEKLLEYPYIETTRAPYGIIFRVLKAKKGYRKNAVTEPKDTAIMRDVRDTATLRDVIKTKQLRQNKEYTAEASSAAPVKSTTFFKRNQKDSAVPMTLPEFQLMCRADAGRHVRLLGELAEDMGRTYQTRGQWREFGLRNIRAARRLAVFTDKQIVGALDRIEEAQKEDRRFLNQWGLETIEKYIV